MPIIKEIRRDLIGIVNTRARRQGILRGHRGWLAVFVLLQAGKSANKLAKRGQAPLLFHESLALGHRLEIVHLDAPPTRRQRRKAARRARRTR